MGYTTEFTGSFQLSRELSAGEYLSLQGLAQYDSGHAKDAETGCPGGYCQWTPDGPQSIAWDGNEKFYHYVEWLQFIINQHLKPWGISMTGSVRWSGEEVGDNGVLAVVDGVAQAINDSQVLDSATSLRDGLTNMIDGGRLREDMIPDDWDWLTKNMEAK